MPSSPAKSTFVHLHVHSSFSLSKGALPLGSLLQHTHKAKQPAVAITDCDNLFGALEFSQKAIKDGVQPIIGCKLHVSLDEKENSQNIFYLIFLCMNKLGYENLMHLVSKAHLQNNESDVPHIAMSYLQKCNEGLIVLSGGREGPLNSNLEKNNVAQAKLAIESLKNFFNDRFYIELSRLGDGWQNTESELLDLAYEYEVPIVATNEVYFLSKQDHEAHDALLCIAEKTVLSQQDRQQLSAEHYLKSSSEMHQLFSDLPEALENSIEIARRCAFAVPTSEPILPSFEGDEVKELKKQSLEGLEARLAKIKLADGYEKKHYLERLEHELAIIEKMNYSGYFLIVADFVRWAKSQDIAVGPGRGSGAGSLVAWALTITDLDPMRFSLLFERFLNPERISMPDFDIDFCQNRRDEVIHYVQKKYGEDQVAQIITFGTLQARAVLRDVGRVLQMPYSQVDRLCKLVPSNPANPVTLAQAVESEPGLKEARKQEENVDKLFEIALKLEGLYRHASTHAAGIVIGERSLEKLVPLYKDARSDMPVTQFNMKWVENAGLVKFDFLGLKTLTVIRRAIELLAERNISLDIESLALDDVATFEMLQRGETVGIFQLESAGMRKALMGMGADRFEDIIALVALYRPGPMDNIPIYNSRKRREQNAEYYHEKIQSVLQETYGVIIYQEQVMQIAQILSGYTLGEADVLRRAMGKKIKKEMEQERERFVKGAVKRDVKQHKANEIFDILVKFADYGFNKSHAAAYALLSYQTAWLKCHYKTELMAALMSLDTRNTDKLHDFYRECKRLNIKVLPPCVNNSNYDFYVKDETIIYALSALKGVGAGAEQIIEAREEAGGKYKSLADFFSRIDVRKLKRSSLENLIYAGAFECFGYSRQQLISNIENLYGYSTRAMANSQAGIEDMFGESDESSAEIQLLDSEPITQQALLNHEFSALGFYLSAHPLDGAMEQLSQRRVYEWRTFEEKVQGGFQAGKLAGVVMGFLNRKTRSGSRMGIAKMSDPSGQYEIVLFSQSLEKYRELFSEGEMLVLTVEAETRDDGISLRLSSASPIKKELAQLPPTTATANQSTSQSNAESKSPRPPVASPPAPPPSPPVALSPAPSPVHRPDVQKNLKIFVRDSSAVANLASILKSKESGGRVIIIVLDGGNEGGKNADISVNLPNFYEISPQVESGVRAISGVIDAKIF